MRVIPKTGRSFRCYQTVGSGWQRSSAEARERDERMMAEFRENCETVEKRVAKVAVTVEQHTIGFMPKSEFVATFEQIDKAWRQALEH